MKTPIMTGHQAGFFVLVNSQTGIAQITVASPVLTEATAETVGMSTSRLQRMDAVINDYIAKGDLTDKFKVMVYQAITQLNGATR